MATELGHLDQERKYLKSTTISNENNPTNQNEVGTYINIVTFNKKKIFCFLPKIKSTVIKLAGSRTHHHVVINTFW